MADVAGLARLAWHLGDRHIAVQLLPNRIRVLRDGAIETLLAARGAKITPLDAPFEPEGGAYAPQPVHDHVHDHVHDAHCGHDHSHDGGDDVFFAEETTVDLSEIAASVMEAVK